MPEFLIEDSVTGMKLQVSGDDAPDQDDAHELMESERSELHKNVIHGPENRIILDVGPLRNARQKLDSSAVAVNRADRALMEAESLQNAWTAIRTMQESGAIPPPGGESEQDFENRKRELIRGEMIRLEKQTPATKTATEVIFEKLPPNSLLINSHGSERGGLYTDEGGHKFTLHNLSIAIGEKTNTVQNVINTSCFGGRCDPAKFQSYFPSVTNIVQTPTNISNTVSIKGFQEGRFFTETAPDIWRRIGTNWIKASGNITPLNGE